MATTKKKSPTKKTSKTSTARATRKPAMKKPVKRALKKPTVSSFKVAKSDTPFMTFEVTRQSVYWLVLGVVVIAFTVWILKLQSDIQSIYDSIDATSAMTDPLPTKEK